MDNLAPAEDSPVVNKDIGMSMSILQEEQLDVPNLKTTPVDAWTYKSYQIGTRITFPSVYYHTVKSIDVDTRLQKDNMAIVPACANDLNVYQDSLKFAECYKCKGSLELTGERPAVSKGTRLRMDTLQEELHGLPNLMTTHTGAWAYNPGRRRHPFCTPGLRKTTPWQRGPTAPSWPTPPSR